jgi:hypothetical protein
MKIELKRISYNARLSQETSAYAADVWVDGKKSGTVQNDGHGGPDLILPHTLAQQINEYAKTLPPTKFHDMVLPQSAESIFGKLLDQHLVGKSLQRKMKTKILFTVADGKVYEMKGSIPPKDAVKVLNYLSIEEAVELYLKTTKT